MPSDDGAQDRLKGDLLHPGVQGESLADGHRATSSAVMATISAICLRTESPWKAGSIIVRLRRCLSSSSMTSDLSPRIWFSGAVASLAWKIAGCPASSF